MRYSKPEAAIATPTASVLTTSAHCGVAKPPIAIRGVVTPPITHTATSSRATMPSGRASTANSGRLATSVVSACQPGSESPSGGGSGQVTTSNTAEITIAVARLVSGQRRLAGATGLSAATCSSRVVCSSTRRWWSRIASGGSKCTRAAASSCGRCSTSRSASSTASATRSPSRRTWIARRQAPDWRARAASSRRVSATRCAPSRSVICATRNRRRRFLVARMTERLGAQRVADTRRELAARDLSGALPPGFTVLLEGDLHSRSRRTGRPRSGASAA